MDASKDPGTWILLIPVLFFAACVLLVTAVAWLRWRQLKPQLFPPTGRARGDEEGDAGGRRGAALRPQNVPRLLGELRGVLEKEKTPEAQTLLEAARGLESGAPEFPAAVHSVLVRAVESGELSSLLVARQGAYAYIVAVPNRHEHPHLLRRYAPFAAGWAEHARLVRDSLMSGGEFTVMLAYLFFLSPDAKEGILLASCVSPKMMLVPSRLSQGTGPKGGVCKTLDAALEFKLAD